MKILWLTWKDRQHPAAGGAETVSGEIIDRLAKDGHEVKVITARYKNSLEYEKQNNTEIYRTGNRYTVYSNAKKLIEKELKNWPDLVIDEMNTIPFGAAFYSKARTILLTYQLAREVWHYQMPFPISSLGYATEPIMLRKMATKYTLVATESESTKKDLQKIGFKNIQIFRVGTALKPIQKLNKKQSSMILSLGAMRPMKRTLEAVKAFEFAKDKNPKLTMTIAGDDSGKYASKVKSYINKSRHKDSILVLGRVSSSQKTTLMQQAAVILVTSIKEGWGLIVTEAATQGTPAIVYDTDGLRDSVRDQITGIITENGSPLKMGTTIVSLLNDSTYYESIRLAAWNWSKEFTFDNSYKDFLKIIK